MRFQMTNQEQDLLEAFAVVRINLDVISSILGHGIQADKKELSDQLGRLQTAANKFLALPRPASMQKAA